MYFKQFYLGCLAQASYMIGSDGEAAVVDPRRDIEIYLEEARAQGLTHPARHRDAPARGLRFRPSRARPAHRREDLLRRGGRGHASSTFPSAKATRSGSGSVELRFLETPGHTPESISIVVTDRAKSEAPEAVLTGDTLFIGDVGRPDLLGARVSAAELAGQLYDSLHEKLLTLPDSVLVYPAHGAGSLCGRNISSETSSTIGQQRRFNYALRPMPREEFVAMMTTDLPEAPAYFSHDVRINREGPGQVAEIPLPTALSPEQVEKHVAAGAVLLDTRGSAEYGAGHVAGSLHIGLSGQFASWAGTLLAPQAPIVLVAEEPGQVEEARTRLARVGLENVAGFLGGGILEWDAAGRPLARTEQIAVDELRERLREDASLQVVDVRRDGEWKAGHIRGAVHVPLHKLSERLASLDRERPIATVCASGYRSSIAASALERLGFPRAINVVGGMVAWTGAGYEVEEPVGSTQ